VEVLSGGEKARLVLATLMASPVMCLLLDEPTNHLDINSVEKLADAMAEFSGTIIFVSHDEYFISRIATRIVEIRPERSGIFLAHWRITEVMLSPFFPVIRGKRKAEKSQVRMKKRYVSESVKTGKNSAHIRES
jgi:ABC-type cobalamin/Fe3+-siderophores transport system ATPase subunit